MMTTMSCAEARDFVLRDPASDNARNQFATACETEGDFERAEFVRLQMDVARRSRARDDSHPALQRELQLLKSHWGEWARPLGAPEVSSYSFFRGFVERVEIDPHEFLARADELFRAAPIRRLILHGRGRVPDELFQSPHLDRIVYLAFNVRDTDDRGLQLLAASPHVGNLKWLDLGVSPVTLSGLEALAGSARLPSLVKLGMQNTPLKHVEEEVGRDWNGGVVAVKDSVEGEALERKFGRKAWLHPYVDRALVDESAL